MQFKDIFEKPIDRPIDAVVKAQSKDHLANELDEYVITPELEGHLSRFFDEYNDPDATGNGAWISGFFGSGKSHLLKILSVVLEDKEVEGKKALDYILPKLADNPALSSAMKTACARHASESVLFNIDIVAPNQGRTEAAALLAAFIKVFNRHCGYFDGDQQHIAKLEYDLEHEGKLDVFIAEIEARTQKRWIDVRKTAPIYAPRITAAFDVACGNPEGTTENIVTYYQRTYQPDIHSFAEQVKDYIDAHQKGFRLNFFVDEVGQFIAQNPSLMIHLQSIAEELNTVCKGDSWIVVTSQENMEETVGEMSKSAANDFSKIQARFKIKMQLTSNDARTVIKQRLLAKNRGALPVLSRMYAQYEQDFRVLFDFTDGSKHYITYKDEQDFIDTYPFVPYQFDLFITAMRGLSDFNAFTGRHHSTGARSMLGVFQQVGIELSSGEGSTDSESLAAFDAMFEGLRNSLRSEMYGAISTAETNLTAHPLAIRVLKALLLVKYCKDFKATPSNIRVLLYGSFKENIAALEQQIKEALYELESQFYIKRNVDTNSYEYLTDEEKDIEKEIRNVEIPVQEGNDHIAELFKEIVGPAKVNYTNGGFCHSFSYNLKIDGTACGHASSDLSLDITFEKPVQNAMLENIPSPPKTLTIVLRNANDFSNNVASFLKTRKYIKTAENSDTIRKAILADKGQANSALSNKLHNDLDELLSSARYLAAGVEITDEVSGNGKTIIACAMAQLIKRSYTALQQIKENYTEKDISQNCLSRHTDAPFQEYVETVLNRIQLIRSTGTVTVGGEGTTSLTAYFTKNEYGWPDVAVRNAVAILSAANRIEIRQAGSVLEGVKLADALKRNKNLDKLVVCTVEKVDPHRLAQIKSAYRKYANLAPVSNEPKTIATALAELIAQDVSGYERSSKEVHNYPFSVEYSKALNQLNQTKQALSGDWWWLVSTFPEEAEKLVECTSKLSQMKQFMEGSPLARKWEEIKTFKHTQLDEARELNLELVQTGELEAVLGVVDDPACYKSSNIPAASMLIRQAKEEISRAKAGLRADACRQLDTYRSSFENNYELNAVAPEKQKRFQALFADAKDRLDKEDSLWQLRSFMDRFKKQYGAEILAIISPDPEPAPGPEQNSGPKPSPAPPKTIDLKSLGALRYTKPTIETIEDVDNYLCALREKLEVQINSGTIIMR